MLNGLEAIELKLSEVRKEENFSFRFDSEYFKKEYLANLELIKNYSASYARFKGIIKSITGGATPLGADYPERGVRFLRVQNIMRNYIDDSDLVYISPKDDEELRRSRLKENDVLLTITGVSYGKSAVVTKEYEESNINQHSVRMSLDDKSFYPYFVSTFLNSRIGKLQSDRNITGVTRPALDYEAIRYFVIPCVTESFQFNVGNVVEAAHQKLTQSKALYAEAESLLLDELSMGDADLSHEQAYERKFAEVKIAERFDAEYFHPEKRYVLEQLAKLKGESIKHHFASIYDLMVPSASGSKEWVQNFDLNTALQFFLGDTEPMPAYELGSTKKRFKKGDVVVSRLRSYLKEIAIVDTISDITCVGSSEFIVLRPMNESVCSELLSVYLRSAPVQKILKWSQEGSNHPRFKEEELLSIKLPERIISMQDTIKAIVRNAIDIHRESKRLLEVAKRGVEIAIEENEAAALRWMDENLKR